tara:strand:+ start:2147 stop:2254 length:108 start_codon:yes stop_codon:yes gene_type:complete
MFDMVYENSTCMAVVQNRLDWFDKSSNLDALRKKI